MTKLTTLSPADARAAIAAGACLVDIRGADEFAREHIPGAVHVPLDRLGELPTDGGPVIFHCRSGMRTAANASQLAAQTGGCEAFLLEGGIDAWRKAGLPVEADRSQPIELIRQVQIAAGSLVLLGVLLGFLVAPAFFGIAGFVGAGLVMAGVTGWCGMAHLLAVMPWNRRAAA